MIFETLFTLFVSEEPKKAPEPLAVPPSGPSTLNEKNERYQGRDPFRKTIRTMEQYEKDRKER